MVQLHAFACLFTIMTATWAATSTKDDRQLVVAIYGGGATSAVLAQALKDSSHINLQYFDPALDLTPPSFRSYGFDPKAIDALALVSKDAGGALDRAGWYAEVPRVVVVVCSTACSTTAFL